MICFQQRENKIDCHGKTRSVCHDFMPMLDWLTDKMSSYFGPKIDMRKNPSLIQNGKSVAPFDTIPICNLSNTWHSNRACIAVMIVEKFTFSMCFFSVYSLVFGFGKQMQHLLIHRYFLRFRIINLEFFHSKCHDNTFPPGCK